MSAINLDTFVQAVWSTKDVVRKREIAAEMIQASHAKAQTKAKALADLNKLSPTKIDFFVSNYSFSGAGLKVI